MKMLRRKAGLTQCAVAKALGVRQSAVAMWESGRNHPCSRRIPAIADLYGVPVEEVIRVSYLDERGECDGTVSENP